MRVLDLFSGLGGFSSAFEERGHHVVTVDNNPEFSATYHFDITECEWDAFGQPMEYDVILASPPCPAFSVICINHHWDLKYIDRSTRGIPRPKEKTYAAIHLVAHTIKLILELMPVFWYLENPRGMLRRVLGPPTNSTYFSSWGENRLKPTDLWGHHAPMKWPEPGYHESTPRGSKHSGTLGIESSAERAKIPYELSLAICKACEQAFKKGLTRRGNPLPDKLGIKPLRDWFSTGNTNAAIN